MSKDSVQQVLVNDFGFCFEQAEFVVMKYVKKIKELLYTYDYSRKEVAECLAKLYGITSTQDSSR